MQEAEVAVLVEVRDELVVLDFGAATAKDLNAGSGRVGSLRYMAPELFAQDAPSPQSDVWAIGVILYGCLTGGLPFDGKTELEIAAATRRPPPPPSSLRPGLPSHLDDVVLSALAPDRAVRYADCRAFAAALDEALGRAGVDEALRARITERVTSPPSSRGSANTATDVTSRTGGIHASRRRATPSTSRSAPTWAAPVAGPAGPG